MGDLTREEIRDEVKANLGRLNSIDKITDERYNRNIHLAQLRIARSADWTELRQDVSALKVATGVLTTDKYLAMSDSNKHIYSMRITYEDTTNAPLIYVPQRQWDVFIPLAEEYSTGRPTHYTRWERRVEFYPIPAVNCTVYWRYLKWPDELVVDSAKSELLYKDDMIIALTTSVMLRQLGKTEDANTYFGIYNAMLKDAKESDAYKPDISLISRGIGDTSRDMWPSSNYWADPFVR